MTTSASRVLAAHPRRTWRAFLAASATGLAVAVLVALTQGAERIGITMTVFTGVVVVGALAAVLDAVVSPGNPDVLRRGGHFGGGYDAAAGFDAGGAGGGDCGGGGAHCG